MDITNGIICEHLLILCLLLIFSDFVRQFSLDLRMSLNVNLTSECNISGPT